LSLYSDLLLISWFFNKCFFLMGQLVCRYAEENDLPWDGSAACCCAKLGNLPILQFLHEAGCEWWGLYKLNSFDL
jgi:hypothetical protein